MEPSGHLHLVALISHETTRYLQMFLRFAAFYCDRNNGTQDWRGYRMKLSVNRKADLNIAAVVPWMTDAAWFIGTAKTCFKTIRFCFIKPSHPCGSGTTDWIRYVNVYLFRTVQIFKKGQLSIMGHIWNNKKSMVYWNHNFSMNTYIDKLRPMRQ